MFPLRAPLWSRSRPCRLAFPSSNLCRRQTRWLRTVVPSNTYHNGGYSGWSKTSPWIFYPTCAVIFGAACLVAYQTSQPFRHSVLAVVRCSRVASKCVFCHKATLGTNAVVHPDAAILSAIDYKMTMLKSYGTVNTEHDAYSECHSRSARRVLKALLANGGSELVEAVSYLQVIVFFDRNFHKNGTAYGNFGGPSRGMD
jgi:aarF domain-containing kinase